MRRILVFIMLICCFFITSSVVAESTGSPTIDGAMREDTVVNGHAEPDSVPITIYDLSYPVRTALGSSMSMDDDGNFAVLVSPALIKGHEIVAVDKEGRISQPIIVIEPDADGIREE